MTTIETANWLLNLSDEWETEEDSVCITAWQADSVGALQFSAAEKDEEATDDDLRDFAEDDMRADSVLKPVILGEFSGFELCYSEDEHSWRGWYLRSGNVALFVTYNCKLEDAGLDDRAVNAALILLKRR